MRKLKWLAAILVVASITFGTGCKQDTEEEEGDTVAPADVTELTVQAANGNAVLNWKNPVDTDFAGVQVAMSPAEGTLKNAVVLGKDVVSFDVSGLTVGKEYTFTVKTFDESLNYSKGAEAKATVADTSDKTAPADVTELTVTAADGNAVLAWKNPADTDFAGVQVAMSPAEGTLKDAVVLGKDVVSFDVSGLTVGKEYTFTVKAFDESLNYSKGAEAKATVTDTSDKTAPADVTELTATNKDASVILTWVDATDEDIIGYEVTYKKTSLLNRLFVVTEDSNIVPPGSKGCYISNLTNGTEYQFTVKSVDTSGNKSQGVSTTFTPTSIEKTPLQITLEPSTTEKTNQDVVITVKATTDTANEIKKIAYINETVTNIDDVLLGTNITETKEIIATENGTYSVAVTDTAGGQELAFITVSNIDKTAPSQVTNTEVTYFGALNKFMLSWTNPADKDFAGIVITYGKKDSEETTTIELSNDITSYEIENIPADDSEYTISLKTKDDVENFGEAEIVTLVASIRPTITNISLDRNHLDTIMTNRDITVSITGSDFNSLTDLLVQVTDGTTVQPPVAATIDKENNTATATISAPIPSNPTDEGTTYAVKVFANDILEETTATFNVSLPADVTEITLAETSIKLGSSETVKVTVKGTNFDIRGITTIKLFDSNGSEITTSTITVPIEANTSTTEFVAKLPVPRAEDIYTVKIYINNAQDTTAEPTVQVYGDQTITSVTIPKAGEGYTGELPVTIIGENLKGHAITCSDSSFGNVTYLSDTKATATITCNGVVGENTITVTSGISSASGTVKVVASEKCFSVGDILFTDSTRIKAKDVQYGVPDSQLDKAFAVITSVSYGGGVGKAVGLRRSSTKWSPSGTYSTNFTGIQADFSGDSSSGYTFTGDLDGSDNWEYICSIDPEGTKDPANNYPAFNFALTYGTQAGITETDYETGWYVPSVAELYDVYTNKEVVQTSLNAAGGFILGTSYYWSSSQSGSDSSDAYEVSFNVGNVYNSDKRVDNDVFVLQAFNAEQFNNYEVTTIPSITSVTVANAGEGYIGELPVTIIGENLKGYVITCSDSSFGNVNYVSDNMIKATVNCNGIVGENTITVTSGTSSASGTVKVVAAENCFSVGDILFTDGTRIKAEKVQYGVPDSQLSKAFAVITSAPYGGGVGKAVGLQRSSNYLQWSPSGTTGYNTIFTGIQATRSGDSSSGYTFTGDLDGSDNWEYICSIDPWGTKDPANNYPAFKFALTYGRTAGLTGTEYENGWYVPSVAELYDVYTNKEVVQTSLNVVGGFTLGTSTYWSSSQSGSNDYDACQVNFSSGVVGSNYRNVYNNDVFVLQAFNVEQFNNYEVTTIPSITSVTVANAGEGYTGELPVTIIGENLKGNVITCSDSSFGNVNYVSDNMIKATVNCNGIVGENTITVTSGISSASGTVKVVAAENCFSVGDILFTDGTRIKPENVQYGVLDSQLSKAFAVITSAPYGGVVGKAVGLQRSSNYLQWSPSGTTGYNTNFTGIQGTTTSGDIDGSDNWEYICSIDPEGTKDPATNYPAFNFALTYGTQAGLTGTEYENGWYVPSVAELYDVYTNKEVVQTSLNAVGGFTLGTSSYWSSSQSGSNDFSAYEVYFYDGDVDDFIKGYNECVFVLQAFNAEQFNTYHASITSVTVANAGEGYTGELPVTIIGENLIGNAITCSDSSFGNVNYVSDNMIKATVNCNGIVGENTITVTSGTSGASGTVKVVAAENCFSVGDIILTDGTKVSVDDVATYTIDENNKPIGVIASTAYGGGVGKAVGLRRSSTNWSPSGTTGYSTNFTGIQADFSGSTSSGYTFSGDIDGSENWEYICSKDPEGTKDAATNYPAFNFALTYGTQAGLTGTEYETGWYVPSVAELYNVYTNKEVVQTSLNVAGGFSLGGNYWSSSQHASYDDSAYLVNFINGNVGDYAKSSYGAVFVLQAFNAEQFN